MKKILFILATTPYLLLAGYSSHISPITATIKTRILKGGSWHKGCPVPLSDLRYLTMTYKGFDGRDHRGELIVHQSVAKEVTEIFGKLYASKYPIKRMRLVSDYGASDFQSIEADNTSAFNCRAVTGGKKWSRHSYGKAIDINPIENPYISRSGRISHTLSLKYRNRDHSRSKATILKNDKIVKLFKAKGWRWGGDWHSIKDYQHFDKPGAQRGHTPRVSIPPKHAKTPRSLDIRHLAKRPYGHPKSTSDSNSSASIYIVESGEHLLEIANKLGVAQNVILDNNPEITDPDKIKAGQRLHIPR